MAQLNKIDFQISYHLGTNSLTGDTRIYLKKNILEEEYSFAENDYRISFDPNPLSEVFSFTDMSFDATGLVAGSYSYECTAVSLSETIDFNVHVTIIDAADPDPDEPLPPDEDPYNPAAYSAKYIIENVNISGDQFKLEILTKTTSDDVQPIMLRGTIEHNYAQRKDLTDAVVPSSLSVDFEANENLTLQDLYTEEEGKYKVRFSRNNQVIFFGILKPDGIWEDFVSTDWEISMDAMDGLSILKDLSFVKDTVSISDPQFYTGEISQFDALKQCLHRIGYDLPINITKDLPVYDGFSDTGSVLKSVLMNADRFYQDAEKNNIMDCEEVLKSILEPYSATVIQMNGEWWVFRAIDVKDTMLFHRYDLNGNRTDVTWDAGLEIGSHINDYDIHHVNANQKKSITASTQAFRVNYKYGTVKTLSSNPSLEQFPKGTLTIPGWNLGANTHADSSGFGFSLTNNQEAFFQDVLFLNQLVRGTDGDNLQLNIDADTYTTSEATTISVIVWISTTNYKFVKNVGWVLNADADPNIGSQSARITPQGNYKVSFNFDDVPETSAINLKISIRASSFPNGNQHFEVKFNRVEILPTNTQKYKGEFHTAQRLSRISSVTKADKTVAVGDSLSDIYLGTLYKSNGEPTEFWGGKPLLKIMVEDALKIAPRPMYLFEGDTYGYYPYLSNIIIDNVAGKFQISKYSYNTQSDINRANFREFDKIALVDGTDYRTEFEYDFGNVTKVNIIS